MNYKKQTRDIVYWNLSINPSVSFMMANINWKRNVGESYKKSIVWQAGQKVNHAAKWLYQEWPKNI